MLRQQIDARDGRLALHAVLGAAEYSFAIDVEFHPTLNPLRIRLPLGNVTLKHVHMLFHSFAAEFILPIHIACQNNAPVEVQLADYSGALLIHLLHHGANFAEYASVRYLVEQGGVGTLAARNRDGALPLHVLCGSTSPSLRTVQYLIQSCSGSLAARTKNGHDCCMPIIYGFFECGIRTVPGES